MVGGVPMDEKTDRPAPNQGREDKLRSPGRRQWHAPQFLLTEMAATDHQITIATDNAPTVAQS